MLTSHAQVNRQTTHRGPLARDRITVLRIMDRLNIGGPAIHAVLTSKGLDPTRFRTVLVVGEVEATEGDMSYLLEQPGMPQVIFIPSLGRELRPLKDLKTLWQLMKIMWAERPQVVHTHKAKAGALGRLAAVLCRVPVRVHTYHGHVLSGYFGPRKSALFALLERTLARFSSILITPSATLASELSKRFHIAAPDRFSVVALGFDLTPFGKCEEHKGKLRSGLGLRGGLKLIGIVGRMVGVKDHATFVHAAALLAARRDDFHIVFVGGGELESALRLQCQELGLADRAHFLGWRKDMPHIYADLDVLALSSVNEGTPVAIIEALASGVPVVATNVGGVSDVLRQGSWGTLVPPKDPEALAAALSEALHPAARERSLSVRAQAMVEYGGERLCRDLERLYLGLLSRHPQSSANVSPA